jgi:hypothetical protein
MKSESTVSGSRLRESPRLLVLELDHFVVAPDDFVALVLGFLEELGKCEPLAGYEWC